MTLGRAVGERPLVSIIVPSYNQGRFLRWTLDSIMIQAYRPLEVLVMDGASNDETVEILEDYAARHPELAWCSEPDNGVAEAVNKGLARARGEIAGIQSSDDIYLPGAIEAAVVAFRQHPDAGIVYGDAYPMGETGEPIGAAQCWPAFTLARYLSRRTFINQSSAFFRPELARSLGGWRERYYVADVDLWLRMVFRAKAVKFNQTISAFRIHNDQRDKQTTKIWNGYWRMIEDSEDIRNAPWYLRCAADAGRRIVARQYNSHSSSLYRFYQAWRAILTYPPVIHAIPNKSVLLPGLPQLRAIASRLCQRMRTILGRA